MSCRNLAKVGQQRRGHSLRAPTPPDLNRPPPACRPLHTLLCGFWRRTAYKSPLRRGLATPMRAWPALRLWVAAACLCGACQVCYGPSMAPTLAPL